MLVGLFAGVIRGLTGFGAALVIAPGLTLFMSSELAVPTNMVAICATNLPLVVGARREADYHSAGWFFAGSAIALPFGVWLLATLPRETLEWAIGLSVIVAALLLARPKFRLTNVTRPFKVGAGMIAGLMNGSVGMGGPPVILTLLASGVPPVTSRATLIVYFTAMNAVSVAIMAIGGLIDTRILIWAAIIVPPLALGQRGGEILFRRGWSNHFRPIAIGLLVATGVVALLH